MIDHMLVNLKKYYEGKFPCYIGMNIKAPKSSLPAYYIAENPVDGADMLPSTAKPSLTPAELENKEVIAQRLNGLDDFYLLIQPAGYYSYINCWIKLSDLVKNGGVSASLTHVCHALSLVRKVLSMAIEKMKFQLKDWYEGTVPNYIGKTIKLPQGAKIQPLDFTDSEYGHRTGIVFSSDDPTVPTSKIIGQLNIDYPIQDDLVVAHYSNGIGLFAISEILKNGGYIA